MAVRDIIEQKLDQGLTLKHLEIINESDNHNVPPGSESHFKLVVVSDAFNGCKLIDRHKVINRLLADELAGAVHALAMHTFTEDEWKTRFGDVPMSPPCAGKN